MILQKSFWYADLLLNKHVLVLLSMLKTVQSWQLPEDFSMVMDMTMLMYFVLAE